MNSSEKKLWFVVLAGPARKSLKRVPPNERERILRALIAMEADPLGGDVRKLKGNWEGFRRRVGDWRIFFGISPGDRRIVVTAIERRTSATY